MLQTPTGITRLDVAVALALALLLLLACGREPEGRGREVLEVSEAPGDAVRNVVFVLLDTLRADHVSFMGYPRKTTPFLDEIAATGGVVFDNVTSVAPTTFPAVNTLFTGRQPDIFYRTSARDFGIPQELDTLAEIFRDHQRRTAAVSPSPVVRASPSFFNPDGGYGQGFENFDESCGFAERHVESYSAPCVTERAIEMLESFGEDPFLLYVHYLDPHDPYQPPKEHDVFSRPYAGKRAVEEGRTYPLTQSILGLSEEPLQVTERDIEHLVDLYDGEIRAVDGEVRRLFEAVEATGRMDETLFVIVSDHGESFLEHEGILQHGHSLYESELHVLFMLYRRGWRSEAARSEQQVCSVDVFPTVLELADLPAPDGIDGRSVLSADGTFAPHDASCFSTGRPDWGARSARFVSLRDGDLKVIYDREHDRWELYELMRDPGEKWNLLEREGEEGPDPRFESLRRELLRREAELGRVDETPLELEDQAREALEALGYVGG